MDIFIKLIKQLNLIIAVLFVVTAIALLLIKDIINPVELSSNGRSEQQTLILSANISNNNRFDDLLRNDSNLNIKQSDDNSYIRIPSIGVDTKLYTGEDPYTLEKGAWILPYHGLPSVVPSESPIVIAAHRWGANGTSYDYRAKNLFFNLPSLKEGDVVELVWGGDIFRYRINYKEENTYVSRLEDLILVTCKYYDSLERVFVYAEKI